MRTRFGREGMEGRNQVNLLNRPCIQRFGWNVLRNSMTTWSKRDWQQFYEVARRPWRRRRPPRPVYPTGLNRVLPAQRFNLSELDDAGVDLDLAERLELSVESGPLGTQVSKRTLLR